MSIAGLLLSEKIERVDRKEKGEGFGFLLLLDDGRCNEAREASHCCLGWRRSTSNGTRETLLDPFLGRLTVIWSIEWGATQRR